MAKRKRLAPPIAPYQDPGPAAGTPAKRTAPIADVAADAATSAALSELSQTLQSARDQGRMILSLPLDAVQSDYLLRDRRVVDDDEMDALIASISARGQQTPIEVVALEDGRYGLISGWRRLQALRRLQGPDGSGPQTVLALLRVPEQASDAYVAMVEENEIRVGISFYERARIVRMSAMNGVFDSEKQALREMFGAASRSKRSKIGSFVRLHAELDRVLKFPEAIGERLGLALVQRFDKDPQAAAQLRTDLREAQAVREIDTVEAEQAFLQAALTGKRSAAKSSPKASTEPVQLRPGLHLKEHRDGSVTISGTAVGADLRARLVAWLRDGR
ncbi:ParB N-terminal domain-containing protein [uncultured Pseudosulfitobacter sp.]|jgi:ParB family chromosome partitioning protein|uniref:ParB/RepB/Spo0J family partition protein n=1 Tax=uncultured Pseudosulfitobacter sp. TaxID=2854214 RepID=UPI0030DB2563|tara:strand:+ start:7480 stop:8475 length:996 start_codon:yes stop_codon:yes gene_type:complete